MSATNEAGETSDKEAPKSGVGPRMLAMNRHGDRDRAARLMGATQDPKPRTRPENFFPENPINPPQPIRKYGNTHGQDNNNTPAEDIVEDANEQSLPPLLGEGFPRIHANNVEAHVKAAIPGRYFSGKSESERSSTQPPTIYTVPRQLAMSNPSAYTPCAVRLGFIGLTEDFRSKIKTPGNIEKYKMCCVRRLITGRRLQAGPSQEDAWTPADRRLLHQCLATLKRLVPRIRAAHDPQAVNAATLYYDYGNDDLMASHSLRDGCFVLHRLLKYARIARRAEQGSGGDDEDEDEEDDDWTLVFGQCWVWGFVTYDLLLLQNQIPFFVLHALFDLLKTHPDEREDVLVTGALQLFRPLHPHGQHSTPIACRDVHHLLHLFYLSISFPAPKPTPKPAPGDLRASTRREHVLPSELPLWVPCAKELEEVGVTLRARKSGAVSFLDVRFHGGVLEIPPLQLYDYSESMFRNLIAFAQTYPATSGHITAYASFMACLVTTHEDMRLLHQSGILVNQMSSGDRDACTRFFSSISAQAHTSVDLNYLAGVMEEVVKYQSGSWPWWRASLVRNYFSNPWVITSVVAAVFLLCLTVVQTFFAAYAYFKPPAS